MLNSYAAARAQGVRWARPHLEELCATIRRALEVGINHIETARGYGTSELQLGRVLPSLPRDQIILQTKVFTSLSTGQTFKIFHQVNSFNMWAKKLSEKQNSHSA